MQFANRMYTIARASAVVLALALFAGCPAGQEDAGGGHDDHGGHDHAEHGPHDGELVELGGGEYHAEVVHDDEASRVTVYILDGEAKDEVAVDAAAVTCNALVDGKPVNFEIPAKRAEGATEGPSACFELVDENLLALLEEVGKKLKFNVTIEEKPYSGTLEVVEHHHDHGHAH